MGLIPRPQHRTRSETGIWGRSRGPGTEWAQKLGFWVNSRAPLAVWAKNGGFWGRRVPGPRRYLLRSLTFSCLLFWGELLVFKPFFEANCPFWGESRRFWHCHCGEGRETTPTPHSPNLLLHPFALGENPGKTVQKHLPLPRHHAKALTKHFFWVEKAPFLVKIPSLGAGPASSAF